MQRNTIFLISPSLYQCGPDLAVPSVVCDREDYVVREGGTVRVCARLDNPSQVFPSPENITATLQDPGNYTGLGMYMNTLYLSYMGVCYHCF